MALALAGRSTEAQSIPGGALPSAGARQPGDPLDRWAVLIAEAAARFDISEAWIRAVMRAESGGLLELNGRPITSSKGAMGLMQVMPETYEALRRRYGLGSNPYDPRDNVMAGAAYLRELYDRYGYPNLFAAYNAGPARIEAHWSRGYPLPGETQNYLDAIGKTLAPPSVIQTGPPGRALFFNLHGTFGWSVPIGRHLQTSGGLFVPLS